MDNGLSASDIALLGNNNGMWGEGGAFMPKEYQAVIDRMREAK